ncbi:penicillin-binding protein PBP2X [Streptococcus merionis]|uniref:penicillin-binding protein PBP2X n=1 Tax=Streptococcus merionis TaxID=400065 RepID=UPI0035138415
MSKRRRILAYALSDRKGPRQNRRKVGRALSLLSVFLFLVFLINFAIIMITGKKFGQDLRALAADRHQTTTTVHAKRGTIYDRSGTPIAEDSTTYSIYAILSKEYVSATGEKLFIQPEQMDDVATILSEKLGLETDYVKSQLKLENQYQVSFGIQGNNISYGTKIEIEAALQEKGITGIGFTASPGRLYPNGIFASHFIGYTSLADNKDGKSQSLVGSTGLEESFNTILSGVDGITTYEKTASGVIKPGTETITRQKVDGQDVYTTLSEPLQSYLETNMDVFQSKANGVLASATLVSAKTGEILATTQRPTFDLDTKEGLGDLPNWSSALYQTQYEPGSTMKVMTLASAIDNGTFDPTYTYSTAGYTVIDTTINDWDINMGLSDGRYLNLAQAFAHSSNIGMVILEQNMGDEKWLKYLYNFDFGLPTRFGMLHENFGLVNSDNKVTTAMSAFGQGISVTQIQLLKAFSAIANDGEMLTPKFVSALYDPNSNTARKASKEVSGKPISADAANQTLQYMVSVGTDPYVGTLYSSYVGGSIIQVNGVPAAVKSGTAEIAKVDGSGYIEGSGPSSLLYSVVAMFPAEDPDFYMYVTLQQPEHWDVLFWMDVVNPVLEEAMRLKDTLGLTKPTTILDDVSDETEYKLPNVIDLAPGDVSAELRQNLVQPIVVGTTNKIKKTSVKIGTNLHANQQILLWTGDLKKIPDMYDWTKTNVDKFSEWTGIEIVYKGTGDRVTEQGVDAETPIDKIKKITITLGD